MNTSTMFGHSNTARMLALRLTHGENGILGQLDLEDRDVEDIIDENKWLRNWSASMCRIAGEEPGTAEFERCQQQMAERAIEGAPPSQPGNMMGAPEGAHGCAPCASSGSSLLTVAHALGRELAR